jgi:cell division septal protein FtsQ
MDKTRPRPKKWSIAGPLKRLPGKWQSWLKILIVILLIIGLVFLVTSDFFKIDRIECHLNGDKCRADIWSALISEASGQNIFIFSATEFAEKIRLDYPDFSEVSVNKKLPTGLLIKLNRRQSTVALSTDGRYFLVDQDGVLLEKNDSAENWPVVFSTRVGVNELGKAVADEPTLKAIQILSECRWRLLEPLSASVVDENIIEVSFPDEIKVTFAATKSISSQLDSLQLILKRTKMEGSRLKQIDLRFDKPVVVQ